MRIVVAIVVVSSLSFSVSNTTAAFLLGIRTRPPSFVVATRSNKRRKQRQLCHPSLTLTSTSSLAVAGHYIDDDHHRRHRPVVRTMLDPLPPSSSSYNNDDDVYVDDSRDWQYVLHVAEDAAQKAGELMIQAAMPTTTTTPRSAKTKANVRDIVTDVDIACQHVIQQTLAAVFPNDVFLGEESVDSGSYASTQALHDAINDITTTTTTNTNNNDNNDGRLLWIVDPIDGTTNFQAGLPLYCVSIGAVLLPSSSSSSSTNDNDNVVVQQQPRIVVGVIYNPILHEMTSAVAGRGTYVNGRRLLYNNNDNDGTKNNKINNNSTTAATTNDGVNVLQLSLEEAIVNVGFPVVQESTLRTSTRAVAALATNVRGIRMIACASQVLVWTSRNMIQCYVSWDLNAWDVCAGRLILHEAGGTVVDFDGRRGNDDVSIETRDLIFTSPNAHPSVATDVIRILNDNDCLKYEPEEKQREQEQTDD